jgi:hypothetical protein
MNFITWLKARFLNHKQLRNPNDPLNQIVTQGATLAEGAANAALPGVLNGLADKASQIVPASERTGLLAVGLTAIDQIVQAQVSNPDNHLAAKAFLLQAATQQVTQETTPS